MILQNGAILYHASYTIVKKIDLSLCASGKDFGKGFYVTTNYEQALRFLRTAIGKAIKNGVKNVIPNVGFVSSFEYKPKCENVKIFEFENADKNWLHCVVANRKSDILKNEIEKWQNFDIIAGKIANDTTNQILTAYINGFYGKVGTNEADEMAIKFLLPNKLQNQICFKTENAIQNLVFLNAQSVGYL